MSPSQLRRLVSLVLVLIGILPLIVVLVLLLSSRGGEEHSRLRMFAFRASNYMSAIDALLYERYGDAQSFALNPLLADLSRRQKDDAYHDTLNQMMNRYAGLYGVYRWMVLLDLNGSVIAASNLTPDGKTKLDTTPLLNQKLQQCRLVPRCVARTFSGRQQWFHRYCCCWPCDYSRA